MAARVTRSAVKRETGTTSSPNKKPTKGAPQLSSPPATPVPEKAAVKAKSRAKPKTPLPTPPTTSRKRKSRASVKVEDDINELPHNLGKRVVSQQQTKEEEQLPPKKKVAQSSKHIKKNIKNEPDVSPIPAKSPPKRSRAGQKSKTQVEQTLNDPAVKAAAQKLGDEIASTPDEESPSKKRKAKANQYGLTPGDTPFPDWPHPTAKECQEVNDLLSKMHGNVAAPAVIPPPSTTVSGCGEVPSVLDALIRTLLSAATTGANSSRAFKGLVDTFGLLEEGIGKGSVDWNKVRLAETKEVFEAIKSGGLADNKSKYIKQILAKVYEESQTRRDALVKESKGGETDGQRELEITKANEDILSLDHLHGLPSEEAFNALTKYPGIGPKTASCVLLFCLQRPSFAVDTHVWRLCKYLGWVPPTAGRNATYSHCEVRVPDNLKYPLHQLMIRHGKTCPRCRAATGISSENWAKGCPIDHLVTRTESKKGGAGASGKGKKRKSKKGKEEASDEEESEMELEDDTEEEVDESE
ncbi:MAG: hypothetical protein M4579_001583 [Chaenotheca gracillima]|nr:MAG: hypothetical protein M4579_001583 [Chaenotheca gracillima]